MGEISESLNINTGDLEGKLRSVDQGAKKVDEQIRATERDVETRLKITLNRLKEAREEAAGFDEATGDILGKGLRTFKKTALRSAGGLVAAELGVPAVAHSVVEVGKSILEGSAGGLLGIAGFVGIGAINILKEQMDEYRREEQAKFDRLQAHLVAFEREQRQIEAHGRLERRDLENKLREAIEEGAREGREAFKAREEKSRLAIALDAD